MWASGPVPRHHPLEEAERTFFLDTACTIGDHVVDDQAMWIETPAGLVVLCGCEHSGVMNTVRTFARPWPLVLRWVRMICSFGWPPTDSRQCER